MGKCRGPCCLYLYPAGVIERNPSVSLFPVGFQQPPPGCAFPVRFLNNGKYTHTSHLPGLGLIRPRRFPDVQVGDGHPHKVRLECRRPGIHRLPRFIKHGMPRIFVRTLLGVPQRLERPFLRGCVRPRLPDAVPGFGLCGSRLW